MKTCFILLVLMSAFSTGYAQVSQKDMERYLTNDDTRSWSFQGYKITMGAGCQGNGEEFIFSKDHKVVWKKCVSGQLQVKTLSWSVHPVNADNPDEFVLELGDPISIVDGENGSFKAARIDFDMPKVNKKNVVMNLRLVAYSKIQGEKSVTLTSLD